MAKKKGALAKLLNFVIWLAGIIVSLAVGFALIGGSLSVPGIGIVNVIAGWVVVVTTILGFILALAERIR